ncbi:RelA/SpoT domain-containing protein [Salmonella enterica]|nr:RelA/SpoT domain-containing protein [Salmonella enterica]EGB1974377.1 RelA/SpoT domain-containing protein [Salmonella enterica]EIF5205446.1 RelA/SpoT domain-containing protein [Salmonella enterica]ELF3806033.1 RelA/SpoT domain-containing protein [Salmonella enterica]ELY9432802.1 RelA/SpoT domain-containing protein [Salmonella enterica]
MSIEEFRRYLVENSAAYEAWGQYVASEVNATLIEQLGEGAAKLFIKVSPTPRVKGIESALGKVGRKGYDNPVQQMTDLVGVRFVVLLSDDIEKIGKIIQANESWIAIVSKDYQNDIEKNPKLFDYQSKHFEVRPKADREISGVRVTTDMCCEVQVRTLLQHAYAELVHDSIYKPVGPVPKKAERQIARSMALMETTDELFCNTMQLLCNTNKPRNDFLGELTTLYINKIGGQYLNLEDKINYCFLDEYREFIQDDFLAKLEDALDKKKYISPKIQQRASVNLFFAQPVVIFTYWLAINEDSNELQQEWPLPGYLDELRMILSDVGVSTGIGY